MPAFSGRSTYADPNARSPLMITGLTAWHRADFLGNGNFLIATWDDESGNGYDLTASGSLRPQVLANQQNGLPTVVFDGTNDFMTCSKSPAPCGADNFTQIVVCRTATTGVAVPIYIGAGATNGHGLCNSTSTDITKVGWLRGGVGWHPSSSGHPGDVHRILLGRRQNGNFKMWKSGGASILTVPSASAPIAPTAMFTAGGHTSTALKAMHIAESIIYNKVLSDSEVNYLGAYLNEKWNVPWTTLAA